MSLLKDMAIHVAFTLYNLAARRLSVQVRLPKDPVKALEEFFDVIWVLTIQRNVERQNAIRRRFQGLDFQFIEGIDGRTLRKEDSRLDIRQSHKINEVACTLSHLSMYQAIVDQGLHRVLIFEDDAVFMKRKAPWVSYCLERLPPDWELFYLGYRDGELRGFQREFQERLGRHRDPTEIVSRAVGRGIRTAAEHDFTHAYAVTNAGARKLLQDAYPVSHTADGWLEHNVGKGALRAYISVPKLFTQDARNGSSIHSG